MPEPSSSMRGRKLLVQILGALVGLALLALAIHFAFSEKNAPAWDKLKSAPADKLALLGLFTAISLMLNGIMFWLAARPLHKLPLGETIATNCIATFLSILPFKLGLIVRTLVHVRKHDMPWKTLAAWYAGFAGLTLATVLTVVVVVTQRPALNAGTIAILAGALAVLTGLIVGVARAVGSVPRLAKLTLGAHAVGSDPVVVACFIILRLADLVTFGLRFWIGASLIGVSITPAQGFKLGCANMMLRAVSPAGTLGFTEAGTAATGKLMGLSMETMALLALISTVAEVAVALPLALVGWWMVMPHKLRKS